MGTNNSAVYLLMFQINLDIFRTFFFPIQRMKRFSEYSKAFIVGRWKRIGLIETASKIISNVLKRILSFYSEIEVRSQTNIHNRLLWMFRQNERVIRLNSSLIFYFCWKNWMVIFNFSSSTRFYFFLIVTLSPSTLIT